MPAGLTSSGVRRWRAFNIPIGRPWFVTTFRIGGPGDSFRTTWAAASELELVDLIEQHREDDLVELYCFVPTQPPRVQTWAMRCCASVWRTTATPSVIVIRDVDGQVFPGGRLDDQDVIDEPLDLIVEVGAFN